MSDVAVIVVFSILAVTVLILGLVLVIKTLRVCIRNISVTGGTLISRILALGVTAYFFPKAVAAPFVGVVAFLTPYFERVPQVVYSSNPGTWQRSTISSLYQLSNITAYAFRAAIAGFDPANLIIAFAFWVLIGQVFGRVTRSGWITLWSTVSGRISAVGGKNIALAGVLLLGCYLSIASIASIPWLRETDTPLEPDTARLIARLNESKPSQDQFNERYPSKLEDPTPSFAETLEFVKSSFSLEGTAQATTVSSISGAARESTKEVGTTKPSTGQQSQLAASGTSKNSAGRSNLSQSGSAPQESDTSAKAAPLSMPPGESPHPSRGETSSSDAALTVDRISRFQQSLLQIVSAAQTTRAELVKQWSYLRQRNFDAVEQLQKTIVSSFQENSIGKKGLQERALYFRELDDWDRLQLQQIDIAITDCRDAIRAADKNWSKEVDFIKIGTSAFANSLKIDPQSSGYEWALLTDLQNQNAYGEIGKCSPAPNSDHPPDPPSPGQNWGPFGLVARWLLKTESLPLALITGMLGFGLLGSAVSTFVREQTARQPGTPLVTDLAGIVIRGLSAAIVVFLAAEGGLAIFSGTGSADPNPYVLLFTCLIGAVFSQDVWVRVQTWLNSPDTAHPKQENQP